MTGQMRFTENLVSGGFTYAFGISAVDITGTGSLDIVAADTGVGLYWFENDGHGNFTKHVIHLRSDEWLERHAIADINGDGRPEIVVVDNGFYRDEHPFYRAEHPTNGSVLWFEYDGDPRDRSSWSHHYICDGGLPGAYDVAVADFNGDGRLDVAASSWVKGNQFVWFENRDGEWVKHVIEENIAETRTIRAADINGNGLIDLLGTAARDNQLIWYENPGDPARDPWIKHVIDTPYRPAHGHPIDMDGDGDLDVVMALGYGGQNEGTDPRLHQIVWYENDGHPERTPWKKHVIAESFLNAFEAFAADLDGDGQMEVVATAWGAGKGRVAVFKHQGDPRGPWSMQLLKDKWSKADQVFVADIDGDGRPDVVAAAERGSNEVRWWRKEGP